MKIKTTVTLYDTVELDITLPYYCKDADDYFYAVINEDCVIKLAQIDTSVWISKVPIRQVESKIAGATAITEQEFNQAYGAALQQLNQLEAA